MSGGVDSAVAAALLQKQGYEVIGITMCFNLPDIVSKKPRCCGLQGIEDARRVAHKLGIKHYVLNMQKVLQEKVIKDFCAGYLKGTTPNPCVRCNQFVKFAALLKKALSLNATYLATGHYARIAKSEAGYRLQKGRDLNKDQSYFLYRLNQRQLKHALFPLGSYTKPQVRELACRFGLAVAHKPESQEICFLPESDYRKFLIRNNASLKPGAIIDRKGRVLGEHKGIAFYTIGQRKGLGLALGYPAYITKIDAKQNEITVGRRKDAQAREFLIKDVHFISAPLKKKVVVKAKIRYNHREASVELVPFGANIKARFKTPQFAITPGQSAVFYDKDTVIGGGIIDRVLD